MEGCCHFLEDFPGASTIAVVCNPSNATGTTSALLGCLWETHYSQPSPLAWHKWTKAQPSVHPCKSLKTPNKLPTKMSHRIGDIESLPYITPSPRVTLRRGVAPLQGPGQSPLRPFACCVGALRSVGRCGRCSCWCRFRVRGAQWVRWGCAECGGMCRLCVSGPSSWRIGGCAGCCGGRLTVFAAHTPLPPCVTFRLVVAPLRGPGRSPVLPPPGYVPTCGQTRMCRHHTHDRGARDPTCMQYGTTREIGGLESLVRATSLLPKQSETDAAPPHPCTHTYARSTHRDLFPLHLHDAARDKPRSGVQHQLALPGGGGSGAAGRQRIGQQQRRSNAHHQFPAFGIGIANGGGVPATVVGFGVGNEILTRVLMEGLSRRRLRRPTDRHGKRWRGSRDIVGGRILGCFGYL